LPLGPTLAAFPELHAEAGSQEAALPELHVEAAFLEVAVPEVRAEAAFLEVASRVEADMVVGGVKRGIGYFRR
jgi:hypothetical protein